MFGVIPQYLYTRTRIERKTTQHAHMYGKVSLSIYIQSAHECVVWLICPSNNSSLNYAASSRNEVWACYMKSWSSMEIAKAAEITLRSCLTYVPSHIHISICVLIEHIFLLHLHERSGNRILVNNNVSLWFHVATQVARRNNPRRHVLNLCMKSARARERERVCAWLFLHVRMM